MDFAVDPIQIANYSFGALHNITPIQGVLVIFLILGALYCAHFAFLSLNQRSGMNAWLVAALAVAVFTYALSYAGELLSSNIASILGFVKIEYIGAAPLPALWLCLALFYTNQVQWLKPGRLLLLWVMPVVTLIAVFTNSTHHLYYVTTDVAVDGLFPTFQYVRGPLYWLQVAYTYSAYLGATFLLARQLRHTHLLYRKQVILMLAASLVTISLTVLRLTLFTPIPGLDIVPFALILSCLILSWGIMRYQLIGINPIAREVSFMYQMDGVLVLDEQNQLVDFNPAAGEILHLPPDAIGQFLPALLPQDIWHVFDSLEQHQTGLEIHTIQPSERFFDISLSPLISKRGHLIGSLILLHESTERKLAQLELERLNDELMESIRQLQATEQALQASESHYRLLAENTNDVIWEMDLNGGFEYVSPSVERLRGFTPEEVLRQSLDESVCPESRSLIVNHIQLAIQMARSGQRIPLKYLEIEQPCKDGSTVWTEATAQLIFDELGEPGGFVGVSRNIMERKRAELQLKHDATHDGLTGLPNRVLFMDRLEKAIQNNERRCASFYSVLFLDLDEFKIVNDSLGHSYGDQLLITIGKRLRNCINSGDTVARLGGDEFVFLLENLQEIGEVDSIAGRIQEAIQQPYQLDGHRLFISASIGIIPSISGYERAEDILRDADITMYRAKALGKARYEIFEPMTTG